MLPVAMIANEWLIVGIVAVVLLFGLKRLPEIGKSVAEGIHEFKKASKKAREENSEETADKEKS